MHYTSLLCLICFLSMVDCRPREKKHRTSLYDDFQINNSGSWSQPRSFYHHEDHKVESPKRVTKIRGSNGIFHNGQSVSAPSEQEEQRKKEDLENHSVWEDNVPVRTVGHVSLTDGEKDSENHRVPKDNVPVITAGQISLTDGSENHKDKISVITAGQISLTDKDKTLDEERDQSSDEDSNDDDDNEDDTAEDYDDQSDVLEQSDKDEDIRDGSQTDDDDGSDNDDNDVIDKEKGRKKPEIVKNSRTQKGNEAAATSKWSQKMQQIINEVYGGQLPYSPTKNPATQQLYINPTTEVEKDTEVSTAPVDSIETAKSVEQYTEKSSETSLEMSDEIKDGNNLVTMESETHMVINDKRLGEPGRLNMKSAMASSPVVHREMEDVSDNGKKVRSSEETESEKSLNLEKLTSTPMETTENQQRSYNNVNVDMSDQGHLKVTQQGNEEVIAGEETSYPKENLERHREEALDTKENLESYREEALDTKENLERHREEALDTKENLERHREEALDTKENLERHREEALDTKENLERHREKALDTKENLESHREEALDTKGNLESHREEALDTKTVLQDKKDIGSGEGSDIAKSTSTAAPSTRPNPPTTMLSDVTHVSKMNDVKIFQVSKPYETCKDDGYCPPGRICHRGYCVCGDESLCRRHRKPVCGSDGVLYPSHCELHRTACIHVKHIKIDPLAMCDKRLDVSKSSPQRPKTVRVQNCDFQQIKLSTDPIYAVCDVTEKTSPEFLECEASCGHCKAFTYKSHGGVCRLYYDDACVNMLNDQGQTHYVRECQKNDQHCQVLQIIPGHSPYMCSKATVKASNMIECHDTCIRGHCEAFRFKYSGFCEIFFDKSCVSMLEKGKDNYYVRRCTNPADCKYEEVETVVNTPCDILSSNTDTFEACRDACDDCVAIKYILNTGECSIYQQASCITKHKVNYITRNCSPPNTTVQQNSPQVTPTSRSDKQQINSLPTVLRGHGRTSTVQSHQTDPTLGQNSKGNSRKTEENVVISVSLTTTDPRREDKGNNGIQSQDRLKGEMQQGEMPQGDESHRDMSQGDDSHRDMSQGDDSHRDMSQGDGSHRDMSQGDDSHRDMSQGDGSHRDMSQGDGSQGNRPHEEVQVSGPQTIVSENHFRRPETKEGPLFTEICTKQEYVRMKADILRYHCVRFGEKNCGKDILPKKGYTAALMFSYYDRNMDGFIQGDELWQIWVIEKFERMFPSCSLFNLFKFEESYDDGKINREQFIQIFDIPDEDLREEIHVLKTLSTVGNGLEIRCGIQPSSESSQIIWERNNVNLEKINFPDVAVFSDGTLYFETVQILHIGNWTCHDRDRPGVKQVHVLRVHSPPTVHVSHTPDLLSGADIDLYLHCHAEGLPRPTIQWLFNGKPLTSEHKHYLMIHNNGTLRIHNADFKRDTGAYKCRGKNPAGQTDDVSTIVIVDPKEKYPVFNHRQRQESSFVFHSDGYNVYNPVDCITQRLVRKTFGNLKYIPEELDEAPSLCKSSCHWGQAVNVRNKYIYISQPEQNRVVVIDSAKSKNPVEFIETDKVPVKVHYVEHLDEVWVLCWNSEHDTGSKTIVVIRDASQDFRHSIVHTQPIGYRFDLVQDIFLPPSNDLKHEFKYGYVIHNEQRGLFKLEMDSMHYTKAVDLSMFDCVPQHVEYIPIGGHIVVKCLQRTASGSQTLQILLDYITDIPLANTTMFGTPYVTPDSRNLITVDEVSGQVKVAKILDNGQIQKAFEVTTGSSISDVTFFPSEIGDGYDAFLVSRDSPEIYSVSLYNGKVTTIKGIGEPKKMKVSRYSASTRSVVHGDVFSDYLATASQTSLVIVSGKFHEAHCDFFNLKNPDVVMYNVVTMK